MFFEKKDSKKILESSYCEVLVKCILVNSHKLASIMHTRGIWEKP